MKVSRSTRKILIIILSIILVILLGVLIYLMTNKENDNVAITIVNSNNSQRTGLNETKIVDKLMIEEQKEETVEEEEEVEKTLEEESLEVENNKNEEMASTMIETAQESINEEEVEEIVYDNMTLNELAVQLDKSLSSDLSGKGYLYASYSLEKGVDPYLAVAISLEETGCTWGCSGLVKSCNNVGGMKGSGCGAYGYFPTLDDGIRAFIDNISRNYVAYGLTTAELMNPKYAENPNWASNVNAYIYRIRNK